MDLNKLFQLKKENLNDDIRVIVDFNFNMSVEAATAFEKDSKNTILCWIEYDSFNAKGP